jgi:hypothetical protein
MVPDLNWSARQSSGQASVLPRSAGSCAGQAPEPVPPCCAAFVDTRRRGVPEFRSEPHSAEADRPCRLGSAGRSWPWRRPGRRCPPRRLVHGRDRWPTGGLACRWAQPVIMMRLDEHSGRDLPAVPYGPRAWRSLARICRHAGGGSDRAAAHSGHLVAGCLRCSGQGGSVTSGVGRNAAGSERITASA